MQKNQHAIRQVVLKLHDLNFVRKMRNYIMFVSPKNSSGYIVVIDG